MSDSRRSWREALVPTASRASAFLGALPLSLLRPEELIAHAREHDLSPDSGEDPPEWLSLGLFADEVERLHRLASAPSPYPLRTLVLFCGSGREVLALARLGHAVVGVDYVERRWLRARAIAKEQSLPVEWVCQEVTSLDLGLCAQARESVRPPFDLAIVSAPTYGYIPSRRLRQRFLSRLKEHLRPEGRFLAGFACAASAAHSITPGLRLRRVLARLLNGNRELEPGDTLTGHGEGFLHLFTGPDEIRAEAESVGFNVLECSLNDTTHQGVAVLERRP